MYKNLKSFFGGLSKLQRIVLGIMLVVVISAIAAFAVLYANQRKVAAVQLTAEDRRMFLTYAISVLQNEQDAQKAIDHFLMIGDRKEQELEDLAANPGDIDPGAIEDFQAVWEDYKGQQKATQDAEKIVFVCFGSFFLLIFGVMFYLARRFGLFVALASLGKSTPRKLEPKPKVKRRRSKPKTAKTRPQKKREIVTESVQPAGHKIAQFKTGFRYPNDHFSETFSISDSDTVFPGEVGVEIGGVLRHDSPSKMPMAFLVWLFDSSDIATTTLVVLSPWAYNQGEIRDELKKKGKVVRGEMGRKYTLETVSMYLSLALEDVAFGKEGVYPESFYDRARFAISVFRK